MSQMHIGQALQQLMKSAHWESRVNAIRIVDSWEAIMGKTIAKYTEKVSVRDGVLFIQTNVAPLKHELQANKEQIVIRVNEFLKSNTIKSVVIR